MSIRLPLLATFGFLLCCTFARAGEQAAGRPVHAKALSRTASPFELKLTPDASTTDSAGRYIVLKVVCPDLKQLPDGNPLLLLDVPGAERQQILLSPVMDGVWANRMLVPAEGKAKASVLAIQAGDKAHKFQVATWDLDLKTLQIAEQKQASNPDPVEALHKPATDAPIAKAEERSWPLIALEFLGLNICAAFILGLAFLGFINAPKKWFQHIKRSPAATSTAAAAPSPAQAAPAEPASETIAASVKPSLEPLAQPEQIAAVLEPATAKAPEPAAMPAQDLERTEIIPAEEINPAAEHMGVDDQATDLVMGQLSAQLNLAAEPPSTLAPAPPEPAAPTISAEDIARMEADMQGLAAAREIRASSAAAAAQSASNAPTTGDDELPDLVASPAPELAEPKMVPKINDEVLDLEDLSF